jgi:hypothetical protein
VLRAFYLPEQRPNTIVRTSWSGGSKVQVQLGKGARLGRLGVLMP